MWSTDFDYDGMLEYAETINAKTPREEMEKFAKSAEDVNYHSLAAPIFSFLMIDTDPEGLKDRMIRQLRREINTHYAESGSGKYISPFANFARGGEVVASSTAREIASLTGLRANAVQNFVDENNLDIDRLLRFVKKGKLPERMDLMTAIVGNPGNKIQKQIIKDFTAKGGMSRMEKGRRAAIGADFADKASVKDQERMMKLKLEEFTSDFSVDNSDEINALRKKYGLKKMAQGGKTQGYNDKLDESISMRHGADSAMEQGRKDRRDESEAMERSMGRRKYASVGTMDKKKRTR